MKIKNGKIKNISKKIVAGALTFVLVAGPLAGCDTISIDNINYVSSEQGEFTIDDKTLEYCSFYRVYNNKLDKEYYTIGLRDEFNGSYFIKIYDIFTQEELKISESVFRAIKPVNHYLGELYIDKEFYTGVELKEILDNFCENQKVKTK